MWSQSKKNVNTHFQIKGTGGTQLQINVSFKFFGL